MSLMRRFLSGALAALLFTSLLAQTPQASPTSTDTAATAKVSSEMYRQWHLCQQQGRKGEAPRELLGSTSRCYRSMPRWKL
jgi:hypothetical protein